jgi:hypothetical protein
MTWVDAKSSILSSCRSRPTEYLTIEVSIIGDNARNLLPRHSGEGPLLSGMTVIHKFCVMNIDIYAFATQSTASVVIRSESITEVIEVLQKNKLELMKASQVYQI